MNSTPPPKAPKRKFRKRHIAGALLLLIVIALVAGRMYLPIWLKDYVNQQLNHIEGYRGSVAAIDVHLYRGAYTIRGLTLNKVDQGIPVPFLAIDTTDLSLQWGALFHGRIVSDVHLDGPTVNFAKSKNGVTTQTGKETDWTVPIKNLMPIDINLVEIRRGKITYQDFSATPPVDIAINAIHGTLNNLRNVDDAHVALPSTIDMAGISIGDGKMGLKGKLNPLKKNIDMDIDAHLEGAQLTAFNSFSEAAAALKFKRGTMDIYSELIVKDNQLAGYVKPIVHDMSVDRVPRNSNPLEVLWAGAASVVLEIFQNQPHNQFATKVPLTGSLDKIETRFWPTLGGIFRNAFVQAFRKGTDGDVTFTAPTGSSKKTPAAASQALNPEERRNAR